MSEVGLDFRTFIFVFALPFLIMFGILSFYFLKDMIEGIRDLKTFLKKRREN